MVTGNNNLILRTGYHWLQLTVVMKIELRRMGDDYARV
jgi:hypothetical protein